MNEMSVNTVLAATVLSGPREACGLVWGDQAYVVPNVAKNGEEFFIMDREIVQQLYTMMAMPPTGVWHSHPGGTPEPSEADFLYHPKGMRMFIVCNGEVYDHGIPG